MDKRRRSRPAAASTCRAFGREPRGTVPATGADGRKQENGCTLAASIGRTSGNGEYEVGRHLSGDSVIGAGPVGLASPDDGCDHVEQAGLAHRLRAMRRLPSRRWDRVLAAGVRGRASKRAEAIKQAVLSRNMPPWGAVKGFGDLRDEQGLDEAQIEMIVDWVDTGTARGNNPRALPERPPPPKPNAPFEPPRNAVPVSGDFTLERPLRLAGVVPARRQAGCLAADRRGAARRRPGTPRVARTAIARTMRTRFGCRKRSSSPPAP